MENISISEALIMYKCNKLVYDLTRNVKGRKSLTMNEQRILEKWGIHEENSNEERQNRVIKWIKPNQGELKLNVDGASRGNPGLVGGGGILRDHEGNMVMAFCKFFRKCTNMEVECRAMAEGLLACKEAKVAD